MAILLPIKRPTVNVWAVVAVIGATSEEMVYEMVEEGRLRAINIGCKARRCLRFTVRSLADYVSGKPKTEETPEQVLADLFPGGAATVLGSNVARSLNCTRENVVRLIKAGLLESSGRVGHPSNGTQRITRRSLAKFIKARLL